MDEKMKRDVTKDISQAGTYERKRQDICQVKIANNGYNYTLPRRSTRCNLTTHSSDMLQFSLVCDNMQ